MDYFYFLFFRFLYLQSFNVQNNHGQCSSFQKKKLFSNVHHFLSKLERILILMVEKTFEIGEIHFKTHLSTLFQICFWILKLWILKMCLQQKLFNCMLFKTWVHNINDIDQNVVKKELYLTHSYKLGMKYAKLRKIDQHKNAMCWMQSLKMILTLVPLAPYSVFAPSWLLV